MVRHCMDVFDRATSAVPPSESYEIFLLYVKKVEAYYGATKTREVFEKAMETVPDDRVKDIALRFAALETRLGEIDRARAIYLYASQFCNPRTQITFWKLWQEFEVSHGNVETFREMQRTQRSVESAFLQQEIISQDLVDATAAAEEAHPTIAGFKRASTEGGKNAIAGLEEKARKVARAEMETKEMSDFKKEVEKDPSVLEKVGRDPMVVVKNLEGVTSEKVFNEEKWFVCWRIFCVRFYNCSAESSEIGFESMLGFLGKSVAKPIRYGQVALKSVRSILPRSIFATTMSTASLRKVRALGILPSQRAIASSSTLFRQDQSRFRNMFLFLQSGQYDEVISEIKKCSEGGFSLSKNNILMLVTRFSETQRYDLIKELLGVVASSDSRLYNEISPLLCYVLLLSNEIASAFSTISQSADRYLADQKALQDEKEPIRFSSPSMSLPQEFLFVRLCIQLISDAQNLNLHITPFSQSLPRRGSIEFASPPLSEILFCYLYTLKYLAKAATIEAKQVPETLPEFFASPFYHPKDTRNLEEWTFGSFTLRYAQQRIQSTLRSLNLLLWYSFSRLVFDDFPMYHEDQFGTIRSGKENGEMVEMMGITETIEELFENLKDRYELWNEELFQFYVFFYSQPIARTARTARTSSKRSSIGTMRNAGIVKELLDEMGKRGMKLHSPLAVTLFRKEDLRADSYRMIMNCYLNANKSQVELHSLLKNELFLLREYVWECGKRNDADSLAAFYDRLCYLNLHLDELTLNELLFVSCYTQCDSLKNRILQELNDRNLNMDENALCSALFESCYVNESISSLLGKLPASYDEQWRMRLTHLLYQISTMEGRGTKVNQESHLHNSESAARQFTKYCNQHSIRLDSSSCELLFHWYCKECDYGNALQLFNYIKRRGIRIESSIFTKMNQQARLILNSRDQLFGQRSVLESVMNENTASLPRQPNRYLPDQGDAAMRRALSVFKRDFPAVSINMIISAVVRSFCESSILHYSEWL